MMQVSNPTPAPVYSNEGTPVSVFNALAPTVFTDLDLSGTVGARAAQVLLRFQQSTGSAAAVTCRRNGDASNISTGVSVSANHASGFFCYLVTDTDDAGIIEWKCSVSGGTTQIWIMSWLAE